MHKPSPCAGARAGTGGRARWRSYFIGTQLRRPIHCGHRISMMSCSRIGARRRRRNPATASRNAPASFDLTRTCDTFNRSTGQRYRWRSAQHARDLAVPPRPRLAGLSTPGDHRFVGQQALLLQIGATRRRRSPSTCRCAGTVCWTLVGERAWRIAALARDGGAERRLGRAERWQLGQALQRRQCLGPASPGLARRYCHGGADLRRGLPQAERCASCCP